MELVDVLIVGAGPTGLTLAIECIRYKLSFRIIDQEEKPTQYSKAIAIQARTLETFQRMGIHERFIEQGIQIQRSNLYFNGKLRAQVFLRHIPSPFRYVLSLEQSKTELIFTEVLNEHGFSVERSTKLLSYEERDGKYYVQTNKGIISAKYLVGCDGAHSFIRKTMGCTFKGKTFKDIFSLADVEVNWNRPHDELHVFIQKEGVCAALPLPESNRYRLIFQLQRLRGLLKDQYMNGDGVIDPKELAIPTIFEIEKLLSRCANEPVSVSNSRWIANFHINSRLSNMYRKGNTFLLGDAAHIHSPVGGQGMNTGIQDAFNLGWKLAYVEKKTSPISLLDTFERERHDLGKKLLKATEEASEFFTTHSFRKIKLMGYLLSVVSKFQFIQKKIVGAISQTNIRYQYPRAPNYSILHEGHEVKFYTLTERSKNFHLLLFGIGTSPIIHPNVDVFLVKADCPKKAILVRPDGYIAIEDIPPFKRLLAVKETLIIC